MIGQTDGGDGGNTTKLQKANIICNHKGHLPKVGSFFNKLEFWENICSMVDLFFNELE